MCETNKTIINDLKKENQRLHDENLKLIEMKAVKIEEDDICETNKPIINDLKKEIQRLHD